MRSAPRFSAASNVTVPFPVPEVPLVTVSHGAFAVAVHGHVAAEAVTVIEPEPPSLFTSCLFGEIEVVQAAVVVVVVAVVVVAGVARPEKP